ncbi:RecT family protein [Vibrio phage 1.216.O._10N.222.55.C12]|nr:RecT family protein [Vibrio phage 1.216.O._10N.222.55.C12]
MNIVEFVNQQEQFFTPVVADESINWGKESQFAIQAFQKNDYLAKIATSNPISAQNAIINVAAIGITLNPASKLAYLVPRDGGVCLDISYMGLLHIAQQAGSILWGQCKLVHANDTYESNGLDKAPTHKYQAFGERGAIVGGYCTVKTPDGDYLTEEMNLADIKKVAATSKAKKGPWQTFWEEMARKTIVKRASKYWPKVDRLDRAIHNLNTDVGEGVQDESQPEVIIDVESHIISITEQKGRSPEQLFSWLSQVYKREIQCFDDMSEDEKQDTARKLEGKQ